jgi:deoxyribonuclease-4
MEGSMGLKLNKLLLGSHVSFSKPSYLLGSLQIALDCEENCFMINIGSPQSTYKPNINDIKISEFKEACARNNIRLENVVVHAPYIINPSSNEKHKQDFAISILKQEVKFVEAIGCKYIVLHPGNAVNGMTRDIAIRNSTFVINEVNKHSKNAVICIETMSGKGTEIGITFEEIKQIIKLVENKSLIGVCFDTCHT